MAVQHKRLGNHGVLVSNICLGTMNFGWHTSEEDSFKIMDRALEFGVNFFDTADVYGWSVEHGLTEEIIGPRTVDQLESAVRAAAIELDQQTLDKLDEIFPWPGGEAPMAYAWCTNRGSCPLAFLAGDHTLAEDLRVRRD